MVRGCLSDDREGNYPHSPKSTNETITEKAYASDLQGINVVNVEQDDARGDSGIEHYGPVLPFWRKLALSTGTICDSLPFNTSSFYLFFFLTSLPANARISPLKAGILVGLPAVLFFPLDPIAGFLSDRVRSRVGRRRIFLITCGPFASMCFFLRFCVPLGWSASVLFTYWLAVQIAYSVTNNSSPRSSTQG